MSSPSCGPQRVAFGYYTAHYTVTYAPQEERTHAKSTRKRGYLTEPFGGYCVNFYVVGLPSAVSTMIPGPGRWGQAEGDQKLVQWQVQQRGQPGCRLRPAPVRTRADFVSAMGQLTLVRSTNGAVQVKY
jgi:hypothetical protein